jgi:hypothetical protein
MTHHGTLTHGGHATHNDRMTELPEAGVVPEWTLGWRMPG